MAEDAPPAPGPLVRAESFAKHADVFNALFQKGLDKASTAIAEMADSGGERAVDLARRAAAAQEKAVEGDDSELRALQAEMAAKYAGDMQTELQAVWDEFDTDRNGELSAAENRVLVKAYLAKQKEWFPRAMSQTINATLNGMLAMVTGMMGGEDGSEEDVAEITTQVQSMLTTVLDQVKPAITEALDGMITDSDRLADDLLKELDLDHDGRVVKDEFITGFMTASERIFNTTHIQQAVQEQVQQSLMERAGEDGPECSIA